MGNYCLELQLQNGVSSISKMSHANGLSRQIPKYKESFEDTEIASLQEEVEIKNIHVMLCGNFLLPLTKSGEKRRTKKFIKDMIERIKFKNQQKIDMYSICNDILMYGEQVVIPISLQKKILNEFHVGHPGISRIKSLMRS